MDRRTVSPIPLALTVVFRDARSPNRNAESLLIRYRLVDLTQNPDIPVTTASTVPMGDSTTNSESFSTSRENLPASPRKSNRNPLDRTRS